MTRRTQTGQARFQRAQRTQIQWQPLSLNQMLPEEHPARTVWAYVESLDHGPRGPQDEDGRWRIPPRV